MYENFVGYKIIRNFVQNGVYPFQHTENKRRYAHHLVVEKRRKLTHVCKKLA